MLRVAHEGAIHLEQKLKEARRTATPLTMASDRGAVTCKGQVSLSPPSSSMKGYMQHLYTMGQLRHRRDRRRLGALARLENFEEGGAREVGHCAGLSGRGLPGEQAGAQACSLPLAPSKLGAVLLTPVGGGMAAVEASVSGVSSLAAIAFLFLPPTLDAALPPAALGVATP